MKLGIQRLLSLFLALATLAAATFFAVSCSFDSGDGGTTSGGDTTGGNGGDAPLTPSAIKINEVCTKNTRYADTHAEDGLLCDWIELYNTSDQDVSLAGWGISDKSNKVKHIFSAGVTVPAKGFLVLWACGTESSSDKNGGVSLPFALSKNGEKLYLFNAAGAVTDRIEVPALADGCSYGRTVDGGDVFAEILFTTLGESNDGADIRYLDASVMTFSRESGFYGEAFDLRVTVPEGYTLYYTDDSSTPTRFSREFPSTGIRIRDKSEDANVYSGRYMGTIEQCYEGYSRAWGIAHDKVDKCNVLRFLLVSDTGEESRVVTKSYFVGSQFSSEDGGYRNLSVVSLVSDPDNFFGTDTDNDNALFTNTKYWKKTNDERPANFTYFSADKTYSFDQDIGVRLHGTSTRGYNQKSMTLFARRRYGAGKFKKAILGGVSDCGSLVLRTDGVTKLQEGFFQSLVSDRAVSTSDYEPTVVFLDGEYYGVFNLMERFSEDYVEAHYGIGSDNVYIVKKGEAKTGTKYVDAGEGNVDGAFASYLTTFRKLLNADLSVARNWQALLKAVDIDSLVDYLAIQTYLGNMDWSFAQNIAVWRTIDPSLEDAANPYADGKWRFVLYDLDFSAGCWNAVENWKGRTVTDYGAATDPFTATMPFAGSGFSAMPQVKNLMRNSQFVEKFVRVFKELCDVNFAPETAVAKTEAAIARVQGAMTKHFKRFGVPVKAYKSGSAEGKDDTFWKVKTYFGGTTVYPTTVTGATWAQEMQFLVTFFRDRQTYVLPYLAAFFGTNTLSAAPVGGGLATVGAAVCSLPLSDLPPVLRTGAEKSGSAVTPV